MPIFADYGNMIVKPRDLALQRGTGNYNPSPNYDQTIWRGPAYSDALNYYVAGPVGSNEDPNMINYYKLDNQYKKDFTIKPEKNYYETLDKEKLLPYVVGSTGLHPEKKKSWANPQFQHSTGKDKYTEWAVNSLHMTPNYLMNLFFSEENVNHLQNQLIDIIYQNRNIQISRQSDDELLIIMRNKYTYAIAGWLPGNIQDPNKVMARGTYENPNGLAFSSGSNNGPTSLQEQLVRLNQSVLEEIVKQVLSGLDMYMQYYKDASSLPMPLDRSVLVTMKGDKGLQENLGFNSGHEMSAAISSYNQRFNII